MLCLQGLMQPEPLCRGQATADTCLWWRHSNIPQRQVWLSLCGVPGSWWAQGFVWAFWASLVGMGFDSMQLHCSYCLFGASPCPWTWDFIYIYIYIYIYITKGIRSVGALCLLTLKYSPRLGVKAVGSVVILSRGKGNMWLDYGLKYNQILSFFYRFTKFNSVDDFPLFIKIYLLILLIWLYWVLVVALGIFDLCCGIQTLSCGMWDLVPWTVIEPRPLALGAWSLSH